MRALHREDTTRGGDRKPYAVLDVETDGLRGGLLYWTATCECEPERVTDGTTAEALWRHVLGHSGREHANRDHVWWAHNGGEYDYVYLFDPAKRDALSGRAKVHPIVRSDQMIGFRVVASKMRTDLRDSYALLPSSLRALTDQLAPELPKGDIGLGDGVTFDPAREDHRAYAARDSQALVAVLTRYRALLADAFGGAFPSWSAASTALRAWLATLPPDAHYGRPTEAAAGLARLGYYGGMVHVGSVAWHRDAVTLDVNSMYPSVMREAGVPDGWAFPTNRYLPGRPGFYLVTAHVREGQPFTFLPYRDPRGQLAWPTGRFRTVISSAELAAARERGIRIEVHQGITWSRIVHPFGSFVDAVEAMRAEGGALAYVGKITANSLYGKFGAKPTRDEWLISDAQPGPDWWPPAHDPDEAERYAGLWKRTGVPLRAPYLMPHWAAWITAHARLRLLELVEAVGESAVLYTDTDSVTADGPAVRAAIAAGRVDIDPRRFGACKIEHEYSRFRALAPKVTEGAEWCRREGEHDHPDRAKVTHDGPELVPVYRAKGIPRRLVAAAFDTGEAVEWDSPNGALQVLQGAPMTTHRHRVLSDIGGSVAWRAERGGRVVPVHLGD